MGPALAKRATDNAQAHCAGRGISMAVARTWLGTIGIWALRLLGLGLLLAVLAALWFWWTLERGVPRLEGEVAMAGLSAPVGLARDAMGTATVTGSSRADVARALGYAHAQDRFFRMDLQRRIAAGELSALMGDSTLAVDRTIRPHRFRARARAIVAGLSPAERAVLDAYVAGVNQGLNDLKAAPFEYLLLRGEPLPWAAEDSVLTVFAMYLNLQPATPRRELDRAMATRALGAEMAAFLYPSSTPLDAPIDGSTLPEPPMPTAVGALKTPPPAAALPDLRIDETVGSNNWAVGGALTASGAALVANDMHLGLDVPSIWYRARLVVKPAAGRADSPLDATGVTLPGTPFLVAGSNGRIAWGYTNSYIDTADAVVVEWIDRKAGTYRTPQGPATVKRIAERLCVRSACETLPVEETIWGPIIGQDAFGRAIAMRWTAHEADAIRLGAALDLERAGTVTDAIAIAQRSGIPQQNFVVGDATGNIGWTIIGRVPRRVGFDGQDAVSFADGTRRWDGYLTPEETPAVVNPAGARIWTANSRVVGGADFAKLGDGGTDTGARAGRIRDLLLARQRFAPADFLAIQLDDRQARNDPWAELMLSELGKRNDPKLAAMIPLVKAWGGRAVPGNVGYRLVDQFRKRTVEGLYEAWLGKPEEGLMRRTHAPAQAEGPARRLLAERPAGLVPKGHASWDAFVDKVLEGVIEDVETEAGGALSRYTWGAPGGKTGMAGVQHPLARAIAPLGWLTDPSEVAVPGDRATVRAQAHGFGASERFSVSPGREAEGLFQMPGGQAGNPRTPWYLSGHDDWVQGRPTPFLPGPARWTLVLKPAA
jgi:penicillin G amidase